jgi:hypothetical protein
MPRVRTVAGAGLRSSGVGQPPSRATAAARVRPHADAGVCRRLGATPRTRRGWTLPLATAPSRRADQPHGHGRSAHRRPRARQHRDGSGPPCPCHSPSHTVNGRVLERRSSPRLPDPRAGGRARVAQRRILALPATTEVMVPRHLPHKCCRAPTAGAFDYTDGRRIPASPPRGPGQIWGKAGARSSAGGVSSPRCTASPGSESPTTSHWPTTCHGRRSSFIAARAAAASPIAGFVERAERRGEERRRDSK